MFTSVNRDMTHDDLNLYKKSKIDCNIFYQFNRIQLSCRLLIQMCNCKRKVIQIRCCGFRFIGLSLLYNSLSEERLQYKPFVKGLYVT